MIDPLPLLFLLVEFGLSPPATDSEKKVKMTGETAKVSAAEIEQKNLSTFVKWGRDEMEIALGTLTSSSRLAKVCPCPRYPVNEKKSKSDRSQAIASTRLSGFPFFLLIRSVSAWISRLFTPQPAAEYYEQFLGNNVVPIIF